MVDPLSVAVRVLAHGILIGLGQGAGKEAGRDAYQALRDVLRHRYPQAWGLVQQLDRYPSSEHLQNELIHMLWDAGASSDSTLIQLAQRLQQVLDGKSGPENLIELKQANGFRSLQRILDEQLELLKSMMHQYHVDGVGLLSSNISRATEVPTAMRTAARDLHNRIRHNIESIAWAIEGGNYGGLEAHATNLPSLARRERAWRLVEADRALHVSFQALRLSIEYFKRYNGLIIEEIEDMPPGQQRTFLMFANAIMVYELADYVINFIENFTPGGIRDLEDLHQAALRRAEKTRDDARRHVEMVKTTPVSANVRDAAIKQAKDTERALGKLSEAWERYLTAARRFHGGLDDVKGGLHDLRATREGARIRIDLLEQVSTLQVLQDSLRSIQETVTELADFRLARLDEATVEELLGT
jgi:hypothetical protein